MLPDKEQVNSSSAIVLCYLFSNTKSGFDPSPADTITSAGIVVPLTWKSGRSENISVPLVAKLFTILTKV